MGGVYGHDGQQEKGERMKKRVEEIGVSMPFERIFIAEQGASRHNERCALFLSISPSSSLACAVPGVQQRFVPVTHGCAHTRALLLRMVLRWRSVLMDHPHGLSLEGKESGGPPIGALSAARSSACIFHVVSLPYSAF